MGRPALIVLCAADVLVALDGTVVSVALPSIQRDLGFSAAGLQWVVTAYTVALGSFLLLGGRIADAGGPRPTLVWGPGIFTPRSPLSGLAPTGALPPRGAVRAGGAGGGPPRRGARRRRPRRGARGPGGAGARRRHVPGGRRPYARAGRRLGGDRRRDGARRCARRRGHRGARLA